MGCQSRDYKSSDGFLPIFYLSESIKSEICGIGNRFRGIVGGTKRRKRKNKSKRRKYR
jgi:hypothetical protein